MGTYPSDDLATHFHKTPCLTLRQTLYFNGNMDFEAIITFADKDILIGKSYYTN